MAAHGATTVPGCTRTSTSTLFSCPTTAGQRCAAPQLTYGGLPLRLEAALSQQGGLMQEQDAP